MGWVYVHKINEGVYVKRLEDNLEFKIIVESIRGTRECRKANLGVSGLDNIDSLHLSYEELNYALLNGFILGIAKGRDKQGREKQSSLNSVRIYYDVDRNKYELFLLSEVH